MIRKKEKCDNCGREISKSNIKKHIDSCKNKTLNEINHEPSFKINEEWLQINGKYKCSICNKEFSKNGMISHFWRKHIDEGKEFVKNQHPTLGKEAWNKGLTKETDERITSYVNTRNERIENGEIDTSIFSHKHTEETKKKLSNERKKYLKNNKDKHNWSLYHGKETRPEKEFRELIEKMNIPIEVYQYFIPDESDRFYEMDFAVPSLKIDFEINGEQHYDREGNLTPYYQERHNYFTNLGWKVIEIHYALCFNEEKIKEVISNTINGNISFSEKICNEAINYRNIRKKKREERKKEKSKNKL